MLHRMQGTFWRDQGVNLSELPAPVDAKNRLSSDSAARPAPTQLLPRCLQPDLLF